MNFMRIFAVLAASGTLLAQAASKSAGESQQPNISNVTNAATPSLDLVPVSLTVAPRTILTIWGEGLADIVASAVAAWPRTLGGTEVHLASDTCFDLSCDVIAGLLFASPTQLNFALPAPASVVAASYRIVLVRGGQRIDNRSYIAGGPGRITIDRYGSGPDYDVAFQVGYECLYSFSTTDPKACGVSWTAGTHRAALPAITDTTSGKLISSTNPVHQGQLITIWVTSLKGELTSDKTGLLRQSPEFEPVNFGISSLGKDLTNIVDFALGGPYEQFGVWRTGTPVWAGQSFEYPGLDQINVPFTGCSAKTKATGERRLDAYLRYTNQQREIRLYLPFAIRPGDQDCQFF